MVDLAALLLTGSKDNLLAAGLVILTLLLFLATDPRQRSKLVGAVVIAVVAIAVVVPSLNGSGLIPLPQRAVNKFSFSLLEKEIASGQGSGAARESLLTDGVNFVGQTGGFGVGAGNAETHVLELADFPGVSNLHDWWLEVVVDLGLDRPGALRDLLPAAAHAPVAGRPARRRPAGALSVPGRRGGADRLRRRQPRALDNDRVFPHVGDVRHLDDGDRDRRPRPSARGPPAMSGPVVRVHIGACRAGFRPRASGCSAS